MVMMADFGLVMVIGDNDVILRKWPNMPRPYHHIIQKFFFLKRNKRLKMVRLKF